MSRWIQSGIEAYRNGNRAQAQRFFRFALMEKPDDIRAWLWLADAVNSDTERIHCLEQVLKIEPAHSVAIAALDELKNQVNKSNLPHVHPFGAGMEALDLDSTATVLEEHPSPPVMAGLADRRTAGDPSLPQSSLPIWRRREVWLTAGIILAGIALMVVIALLISQGIAK